MSRVIAAVDAGPVAAAVVAAARFLVPVMADEMTVVTVSDGPAVGGATGESDGAVADPIRVVVAEDPAAALVALTTSDPEVTMVVTGLRTVAGGPRPAGHVTREVLAASPVPVVVVPPGTDPGLDPLERLLVPLEGVTPVSSATADLLRHLEREGTVIDTVHVFDRTNVPRFWDRPEDHELWLDQFGRTRSPVAGRPEIRVGAVAGEILAAATAHGSSMIVLEWKGELHHPRAPVVRELLGATTVPLMLVPA